MDAGISGAQKTKSDALELEESQAVVSRRVWVLGTKPRSPAKSLSALTCCAISQGLIIYLIIHVVNVNHS